MMKINVLFFATLRTLAGMTSVELDIPEKTTIAEMRTLLVEKFPALEGAMGGVLFSINREYAFDEETIPAGAEIAIFPPVSGG